MSTIYYYQDTQAAMKSELWKSDGAIRISQFGVDGQAEQQVLLTDRWVYLWGNDTSYRRFARQNNDSDLYSRTPSYEDLIAMDREQILIGELREMNDTLCLYAETMDALTNETERWYILVDNGLLLQASGTVGDQNTYSWHMLSLELETPEEYLFTLPDGTKPE